MPDLHDHLLALLAPARLGDAVAGARLCAASTEVGLRLTFAVGSQEVHVEVEPRDDSRRSAARTARLQFGYRSGGHEGQIDPVLGLALCQEVASLAARNEDQVLAALAHDAAAAHELAEGTTRIREVKVSRILEPGGTPETPFYTLTPYVGCLIGCRFCYAQSRVAIVRRLEGLPDVRWGSFVDVRVNAAEVLASELESLPPRPIKFCLLVSDPYHGLEERCRLTRACLEVIRSAPKPWPSLVLTRSRLVTRDAELLASMPLGLVGASVPTIDDAVRAHFEPRAATIPERLAALRILRDAGARTFAVVQPMLPGSVDALADALAAVVSSVSVSTLRGVERAEGEFADPRFAHAVDDQWQRRQAAELRGALAARGVELWEGELPPGIRDRATSAPPRRS